MSSGDSVILRLLPEVTPGTTPVDDVNWREAPFLSESLSIDRNFVESGLVTPHSQTADLPIVGSAIGGTINTELRELDYDLVFASLFRQDNWTADVLKFGTTRKTFSIEVEFQDLGTRYKQLTGMQAYQGTFTFTRGEIAQVNMTFEGLVGTASVTTSLVGAGTSTAEPTRPSFQTGAGISTLDIKNTATTATVRSVVININNNLRGLDGLGSDDKTDVVFGAIQVTGNADFYLGTESFGHFVDKLNNTNSDLTIRSTLSNGAFYEFDVPNLKWGSGNPGAQGRSTDVMVNLEFTGIYDNTELSSLVLTRGASS